MSKKVVLPVPNDTTEGFELKTVLEVDLDDNDKLYLQRKAELQQELGNEAELQALLEDYVEYKRSEQEKELEEEAHEEDEQVDEKAKGKGKGKTKTKVVTDEDKKEAEPE